MSEIKNYPLRIPQDTYEKLLERTKHTGNSVNAEIISLIEYGLATVRIPVVGTVDDDGNITLTNYWDTPEGMKEAAERG